MRLRPFGSDGSFADSACDAGLLQTAVKAAGVTVLSQGVAFVIQLLATATLGRLLRPYDFGLVAIVTTFSLLFSSFGLNGFTEAILHIENVTEQLASNLFWINTVVSLALTGMFALLGTVLARFYGDPEIQPITIGLSLTIALGGPSIIHLALLKRAMRFNTLSTQDVLGKVLGVIVSIVLAWRGFGYWALVISTISQCAYATVAAWSMCRWIPVRPRRLAETAHAVWFAQNTYGHFVLSYFARNLDYILLGKYFGTLSLGLYKKAYDLFALPANQLLSPMSAVVLATLNRVNRNPQEYRRYFQGGLALLALIGMAVGAELTLVGKDLIRLLLGPQWDAAGRIFTYFGPGIGFMLIYSTHNWMHLSLGRADRWLRWGILEVCLTATLFVLALRYGPAGIAAAWTVAYVLLAIPGLLYAGRPIGFGVGPVIALFVRYTGAAAVAAFACKAILLRFPGLMLATGAGGAAARILICSMTLVPLYCGAVVLAHGGIEPFRQMQRLVIAMLPTKWAGKCLTPRVAQVPALSGCNR